MTPIILDGKEIANNVLSSVKKEGKELAKQLGRALKLAIVSVGEREDSISYIKSKLKKAKSLGFEAENIALKEDINQNQLESIISNLSDDPSVDGIILQLPITKGLDSKAAIDKIYYKKDLDGLTTYNKLNFLITPCTPLGIVKLIEEACLQLNKTLAGMHVVIVGRSDLVGKPTAELLLKRDCSVTICHSKTKNLEMHLNTADILVAALGSANHIKTVKKGAIVIDVGINYLNDIIVGDVDFDRVKCLSSAITPVPGGVGPMTVAMLMQNLLIAAKLSLK